MEKLAFVKKLPNGKWRVYSRKGKNLGTFNSETAAKKHLREIEYFKHQANRISTLKIILAEVNQDMTFSSTMRKLRKDSPNQVIPFLSFFKSAFELAQKENLEDPEQAALLEALQYIEV